MATPFIGEIKIASFNFPPKGWAFCNGQLLPINQNQALFSLLGTTYGGDGWVTFALPDLRDRIPFHFDDGMALGARGGEEAHTVTPSEMPAHTHPASATSNHATERGSTNSYWAANETANYTSASPTGSMSPTAVTTVGGSQPHTNMPPYLVLNFIIALEGIFPSQT